MLSKKIIIPVTAVVIGGAAIFGTTLAFAQSGANGPFSGLAQIIAQKFNIDQTSVQQTIDQFVANRKTAMQQKMQQMEDQRLSNLVAQGKITNDQKTAIENELASLKNKYLGNLKSLTPDQRKQNLQNYQNDLKSWASSQGIDLSIIMPKFGMGNRIRHFGKVWGSPQPTSSPQV